ncbi:MAG: sugar-binding protein [Kiritimatiellia bacterium]
MILSANSVVAAAAAAHDGTDSAGGAQEARKPERTQNSPALAVSLAANGLHLDAGNMGEFVLAHPQLNLEGAENHSKPIETRVESAEVRLFYKNGGLLVARLDRVNKRVVYRFEKKPDGLRGWRQEMFIPFHFNQGGSWRVGSASAPFPAAKGKAKLFQGHGNKFSLIDPNHSGLVLSFSGNPYIEIQDNREWNWNIFWSSFTFFSSADSFSIGYSLDTSAYTQKQLVDEFGQVPRDWPGKIEDVQELEADALGEKAVYEAYRKRFEDEAFGWKHGEQMLHPAKCSAFGGLQGAGEMLGLQATGFFHVEKKAVRGKERWFLVDPEGEPFFHLGICCFGASDDYTDISGREGGFAWLPPHEGSFASAWKDKPGDWWNARAVSFFKANVIRKYGAYDEEAVAERNIDRVRSIGFNSVGAFSSISAVMREKRFPYVGFLDYGKKTRNLPNVRGMFDPFDPETAASIEEGFAKSIAPKKDDPYLIGYYLANEQALEDLPRAIPALDKTYAAKRELVRFLSERYHADPVAFSDAWRYPIDAFDSLLDCGIPVATKRAHEDMAVFTGHFLDRYYRLIHDTFRRHDPNHLLIGSRWQPGTANSETLCRVAGRYLDIISVNYYAAAIDEAFIKRIYEWSGGRPQFWSEFYYTATAESNSGPSGYDLPTQRERGLAYRNYVEGAAAFGFVTGIEWFTLIDQAATGRFFEGINGERNNTGLFNVLDRPYTAMMDGMLEANAMVYRVWMGDAEPYRFDHPRFNPRSINAGNTCSAGRRVGPILMDGMQEGFPGRPPERIAASRVTFGSDEAKIEADFKVCWDVQNLYLLVSVRDETPFCVSESVSSAWNGDCIEVFLGHEDIRKGGPMLSTDRQILFCASPENKICVVNDTETHGIESIVVPAANGKGYVMEAMIPWQAIGHAPHEGDTLLFDIAVDNADPGTSRTHQIMWNGSQRNSSDRTGWGRLHLVP